MYKALPCFILLLAFSFNLPFSAKAQYTSPNDNLTLTLSDLVELSGGVVTEDGDGFLINAELTIAETDRLEILTPARVRVTEGVRIVVQGGFRAEPAFDTVTFTASDTSSTATNFRGFRFEDATEAVFRNTIVKYGGGIQLLGTPAEFEDCVMRNNGFSGVSNAITYSGSSPVINRCDFIDNVRSAIGSGATVSGAPQITNSRFLRNVTDNSNRPQINLGPGVAGDTLRIENNIIEGFNDNSGGIGLSNLFPAGVTVASIRNNVIINNRFGITQIGNNISTVIEDNIITDNNIQNNPMLGGSGLNFLATEPTNTSRVRRNIISGNLWGVTLQVGSTEATQAPQPDFGTAEDPGGNIFFDNGNSGETHALFNNTMMDLTAIGNYWGDNSAAFAESVIAHQPDNPDFGLVTFEPVLELNPVFESLGFLAADNLELSEDVVAEIDPETAVVSAVLPAGTNLSNLIPSVSVQLGVSGAPEAGQALDFTVPVSFTLSTPHGEEQTWTTDFTTAPVFYNLQFAHFSPDPALETVSLFVDGELVEETLSYESATAFTPFSFSGFELPVELRIGQEVVFEETFELGEMDNMATIAFVGVGDPDAFSPNPDGIDTGFRSVIFPRNMIPVADYLAEYRILNSIINAPAINFSTQPNDYNLGTAAFAEDGDFVFVLPLDFSAETVELAGAESGELIALFDLIMNEIPGNFFFIANGFAENPQLGLLNAETGAFTPLMRATSLPQTEMPLTFALQQNYPNPFNPATNIRFSIPETGDVSLSVYNLQGQRVATLVNSTLQAGAHQVRFDGSALSSGLYLARLSSGPETRVIKMMLVK
ncbi:Por secretion system C-terminal sorting domain-containing protein [Cyclonatronum proteinivorum]|uniref:Por secretion system C-terminal sorting domain-containing protein n=1 Tax=Cyclonatronum proteinivorum TaxID=1457365 RepID=A0A345UGA7_9BACT|nr:T9SS type A sorting domain-containing protein [Cyclonatronum proteinivorum]AXI99508.1 Por secretion system C-terminal sorting domain-containing protein [Cyclonatronum proteinivorum]